MSPRASQNEPYPLVPAVDLSTAQVFPSADSLARYHQHPSGGHRYGRDSSVSSSLLESELESMYPGFRALTFSSGMAAITTLMLAIASPQKHLYVQRDSYRKNRFLSKNVYPHMWLSVREFHSSGEQIDGKPSGDCFFIELPSNPYLRIPSFTRIRDWAGQNGMVVLDSTLAGLGNESSMLLSSVDFVIHSLTKYANGSNDSLGGVVLAREEHVELLWEYRSAVGTIIGPRDATNIVTNLKTYSLRFRRQSENALEVIEFLGELREKERIARLFLPGHYDNSDQRSLFSESLHSPGAVLSFVPRVPRDELEARLESLKLLKMSPSFGSVDTLFEFPRTMSLAKLSDPEVLELGIQDILIRLAIGVENPEHIVSDLASLLS